MADYPDIDLFAWAAGVGVDLRAALLALQNIYQDIDERHRQNTAKLDLPCHRGCDKCCRNSVFLTPLEFLAAWNFAQTNLSLNERRLIIEKGLALFAKFRDLIEAFEQPPPPGHRDHLVIAEKLNFVCPVLGETGQCLVYPARELYARMFGNSFNDDGSLYACDWVGAHLAGREVSLLRVRPHARRVNELPLTYKRQVYPYFLHRLFGGEWHAQAQL